MERESHQFTYAAARALAAAALVATIAFAPSPVIGAETSAAKATANKSSAPKAAAHVDAVEARIKDMHAKLKITPAQEEQWAKVAEVMRDNEKTMEPLIKARQENAKTMTAIDDLKSYGEITDAHADGIKKFTPVFAALYASMSDAQKKDADTLFRRGGHRTSKSK